MPIASWHRFSVPSLSTARQPFAVFAEIVKQTKL